MQTTLGERVRALRKNKGWSVKDLAEAARLSAWHIERVERGINKTPASIPALSKAFGVDPIWLASGVESLDMPVYNPAARALDVQREWEADMQRAAGMACSGNLADDPDPSRVRKYLLVLVGAVLGAALTLAIGRLA